MQQWIDKEQFLALRTTGLVDPDLETTQSAHTCTVKPLALAALNFCDSIYYIILARLIFAFLLAGLSNKLAWDFEYSRPFIFTTSRNSQNNGHAINAGFTVFRNWEWAENYSGQCTNHLTYAQGHTAPLLCKQMSRLSLSRQRSTSLHDVLPSSAAKCLQSALRDNVVKLTYTSLNVLERQC